MNPDRIEEKLDAIGTRLGSMDVTLTRQADQLGEHMRRTEAAEQSIAGLRDDVKPIQRHVAMMEGALKVIGLIATILGVIATALHLLGKL